MINDRVLEWKASAEPKIEPCDTGNASHFRGLKMERGWSARQFAEIAVHHFAGAKN
jgi:hypothetical protein